MQKKIIATSLLGLLAFAVTPVLATEQIAFSIFGASAYLNLCSTCHSGSKENESKGNLKAGINAAYQKDKFGLSTLKALVTTPALTCTLPQVLNTTKTACITPAPTCVPPQVLNTAKTDCVTPPPTCSATEVLNATKTACITKPPAPVKNTKPILNPVAQQWDVQVGETLIIPLSVVDDEEDEFTIVTSKLKDSKLNPVTENDAGLPSMDFEWIPAQANVNKIQAITFQAKEKSTKPALVSNKVSVKVRVWAAGDRNAASITKLNVMTSKFSAGILKLAGNVKFNSLLTATEIQSFVAKNLDLTISDTNGLIDSLPLTLDKKGNWAISIPMISVPCDVTLAFAGQNASRRVVGCLKTAQSKMNNILAANDEDHDKNKKHDD
ncbi:hypothetical protein LBMAG43_07830 [Methylococcaceae bacterium]|nr:hypothetical protein LBMAG43_07830 [Methylococcaceae bacterium]